MLLTWYQRTLIWSDTQMQIYGHKLNHPDGLILDKRVKSARYHVSNLTSGDVVFVDKHVPVIKMCPHLISEFGASVSDADSILAYPN